jgi:cytochrome P450
VIARPDVPTYGADLYSRSAIVDPYPHYAAMRALGPVVWLSRHRAFALVRYADCKATLLDDGTFRSGRGVALNPVANRLSRGTTLNSDGEEHDSRRRLVAHRLTPRALRTMKDDIEAQAAAIVDRAVAQRQVDGVADIASALPLSVVPDLIGWPEQGREHLLEWAGATFDGLGPINLRSTRSTVGVASMMAFARRAVQQRALTPGSLGADVLDAVDAGTIDERAARALMIDYLGPSLDTTISAISGALHLLATHPEQWDLLRADPSLVNATVNEVVRFESPIRAFARWVARDTVIAGAPVRAGKRVLVIYASANRDEREWDQPDRFDIRRDAAHQLGFGHGTHGCAGQGLARLETTAILRALLERVRRIVPAGDPTWAVNNIIRRHERLPLELVPA